MITLWSGLVVAGLLGTVVSASCMIRHEPEEYTGRGLSGIFALLLGGSLLTVLGLLGLLAAVVARGLR